MSEGKITEVFNKGLSEVIGTMKKMSNDIKERDAKIEKLEAELRRLEKQKSKNSSNSSKPPSSDGLNKKTKSLRKKSNKKPGGQKGHEGITLELSPNPDEVKVQRVDKCIKCGASLVFLKSESYEIRQQIDALESKLKIIEYRAEIKTCPKCGHKNKGEFPEGIDNTVQYGEKIKALAVYFSKHQMIPYDRLSAILQVIYGQRISKGSLVNFNKLCYGNLESIEYNIKQKLLESDVIHCDETGIKVNGKLQWTHVVSNENYTFLKVHKKRGQEAINEIDILPNYENIAVHDFWKSYDSYTNCIHAACGAHILRELVAITELEKQKWAKPVYDLLMRIKESVDMSKQHANSTLSGDELQNYSLEYDRLVSKGVSEDFKINNIKYSERKNAKKSTSLNLLNRLILFKDRVLAFMYDFRIPFTNNQAERDLRMLKVSQKISGTYRSDFGAECSMRINGYISTLKKNSHNILKCLESVFTSCKFDPTLA